MSRSTGAIDTHWEKVDCRKAEEIVSTIGNNGEYVGEQDSDELSETLLDPNTRHIVKLTVTDIGATDNLFNDLYGKKIEPRVEFILKYSEEVDDSYV